MNSMEYLEQKVQEMKDSGIDLNYVAWEAAKLAIGWPYVYGDRGQTCTPSHRRTAYNRTPAGKNKDNILNKCQVLKGTKAECNGCKWYPNCKRVGEFDCRGFTYWIILLVYAFKIMGGGCTSQWNDELNWKEKGELSEKMPPQNTICCVFYYKKDPKTKKRTKTLEHTGLYFNGSTIECSNGVEYSEKLNKKWEVWAIPACVNPPGPVPGPTPPGPEPENKPTIRRGSRGTYVTLCQEDLIQLGYDVGKTGADGIFGKNTEAAVKKFQKEHKDRDGNQLKADGIVGKRTWGALDDAVGKIGAQDVPAL